MSGSFTDQITDLETILAMEGEDSVGDECRFVDLGDGQGVKVFYEKEYRDIAYNCQKFVASLGMAPLVGRKFKIYDKSVSFDCFCYLTEVVEPCVPYHNNRFKSEQHELYAEEREEWINRLFSVTGYWYADDHIGNWGFKNQKLVCLDFDKCDELYKEIKNGKFNKIAC